MAKFIYKAAWIPLLSSLILLCSCASHTAKYKDSKGPTINSHSANYSGNTQVSNKYLSKMNLVTSWRAEGKIAVQNGEDGGHATFVWVQTGNKYHLKLFGPFGSGAIFLSGTPNKVALHDANGNLTTAKTPEELLAKVAGWQVPLSSLYYWIRGISDPKLPVHNVTNAHSDPYGSYANFKQQGWSVSYTSFTDVSPNFKAPEKIKLTNNNLKVKIIVKQWDLIV